MNFSHCHLISFYVLGFAFLWYVLALLIILSNFLLFFLLFFLFPCYLLVFHAELLTLHSFNKQPKSIFIIHIYLCTQINYYIFNSFFSLLFSVLFYTYISINFPVVQKQVQSVFLSSITESSQFFFRSI